MHLLGMERVLVCRIRVHTTVLHAVLLEWAWLPLLEHILECQIPMDSSCGLLVFFGHAYLQLRWCLGLVW